MKNLLLEGRPGVGKSTLILETLGTKLGDAGGFRTVRLLNEEGQRVGFAVEPVHVNAKPEKRFDGDMSNVFIFFGGAPDESLQVFPASRPLVDVDKFVGLALATLENSSRFLVMDEFGGVELENDIFTVKAKEALAGDRPVIGVIKSRRNAQHATKGLSSNEGLMGKYEDFRGFIEEETDTEIIALTDDNRGEVQTAIKNWVAQNLQ